MKKNICLFSASLFAASMFAQQPPTNNNPALPIFNGTNARDFWSRAGNTNQNGFNNIFGTLWNSPIYMQTDGGNRIQVNHKGPGALQNYAASLPNPLPGTRLTRIGISRDGNDPVTTPLSLLHLGYNSPVPFAIGTAGYRSWQDIGTMCMAETDNFRTCGNPQFI